MGVWIEISSQYPNTISELVTPCVGVWIEIRHKYGYVINGNESLPAWECGLKLLRLFLLFQLSMVTPCVGVWIEISYSR